MLFYIACHGCDADDNTEGMLVQWFWEAVYTNFLQPTWNRMNWRKNKQQNSESGEEHRQWL